MHASLIYNLQLDVYQYIYLQKEGHILLDK